MDEVNIYIEEIVLDGASPLSPEHLHAALSREAPAVGDKPLAAAATAVADQLQSRLGGPAALL